MSLKHWLYRIFGLPHIFRWLQQTIGGSKYALLHLQALWRGRKSCAQIHVKVPLHIHMPEVIPHENSVFQG